MTQLMQPDVISLDVSSLSFDQENPRLADVGLTPPQTDQAIIKLLWITMDVRELAMSIAASGFFPHEPLIVANEGGLRIVIEGNRRLAAVRLLTDARLAKDIDASVPSLTDDQKAELAQVPVIMQTRKAAWRYLGFKHVNGPARWNSFAKSKYVADVHRQYGISLQDIAEQIGDTHKTVQRLYRGLMVIEQAERTRVYNRDNRWHKHFSFSHLYTGIQYPGISTFISLRPETAEQSNPVPATKLNELGELCRWLYGDRLQKTQPAIQRQNPDLRRLDAVLAHSEAVTALRNGTPLERAFEISRPSSGVFMEALVHAKQTLQKARGLVTAGFDGSEESVRTAETVANIADDLYQEMERLAKKPRRRRYTED